ncbi:MAG: hypothetical protein NZ805_01615 [Armatimonadetes bacterium]|nr:hypothetical protein [Armatimonadota bacterium]MDW8027565.1 hypothetical protein [Armatimonadota bacterium]
MATLAEEVQKQLVATLAPYMGKVSFGNLRFQISEWTEGERKIVNIAIVYETPGSSTNQLNITVDESKGAMTFIDGEAERQTKEISEVVLFVEEAVRSIPERRLERLRETVRRWAGQGRSRAEVLAELNRLLRADLIGGTITHHELKATIQYCLQLFSAQPEERVETR